MPKEEDGNIMNVAIYVRLSDEDRDKQNKFDESESIQNQKAMLTEYCKDRDWNIYEIYTDEDFSGVDRTRPAFNRMLKACENGYIDIVLCKSQSRFSRDAAIIETYLHDKFQEWGVRFIGIVDHTDTNDVGNKRSRQVNALVNEWYVEEVSENIRKTLKHKREQGQFTGSFAPYGYIVDPNDKNHLLIDENVANNVVDVFEMYAQGLGYRKIVLNLNERGVPSPTAYKEQYGSKFYNHNVQSSSSKGLWTVSTIYTMVRNEVYTGTLVQGKSHSVSYKNKKKLKVDKEDWIRVPGTHEAIIAPDLWDRVQQRLGSRLRVSKVTTELSVLGGKVRCACCGKPMKRCVYYNKDKTRQYYSLVCATYKIGAMNCPNSKAMRGSVIENIIIEQLNSLIRDYCNVDNIAIADKHREQLQAIRRTISGLEKQQQDIEDKLTRLYEDRLSGVITVSEYKMFSSRYTADIEGIKTKIANANERLAQAKNEQTEQDNAKALIARYTHIDSLTREIVDSFIDTIHIGESVDGQPREISIDWNF